MRVYRYGLLAPTEGASIVAEQLRLAHAYRNQLTELERERRQRQRDCERRFPEAKQAAAALTAAQANLDRLLAERRAQRSRSRSRSESAELRGAIKAAREDVKTMRKALREVRAAMKPHVQADADQANEWFLERRRAMRGASGLRHGTYILVEDAAQQSAAEIPLWDGDQPQDPRFLRWTGEGRVGVQIQGGMDLDQLGDHTFLRITKGAIAPNAEPGSRRSRLRRRMVLWLRVGSTEDRAPVWACWPMLMHRPIPNGSRIKRAVVQRRLIGPREEWSVLLTCETPEAARACGGGSVGVDLGWRQMPGGLLRVAMLEGSDGHREEITLPPEVLAGLLVPEGLRSTRDQNFEAVRGHAGRPANDERPALPPCGLVKWLAENEHPDWLREATATLAQWRSQSRLAALVLRWRENRFDGDQATFEELEAWRKQDRHLWLWETSQREGAQRARREFYRITAARLARRYERVVLEKFDLRVIARRSGEAAENEVARKNRVLASVSQFRQCLVDAFRSRGGEVLTVPAEGTTIVCATCGETAKFDAAAQIVGACPNGHVWDQDLNAARNILARGEQSGDERAAGTARTPDAPTESRRERVARLRKEKLARMNRSQGGAE